MQGNPLAVLRYQQRDSILFVSTLPVYSSTLRVADHHSRCCWSVDSRVVTSGTHDIAFVSSLFVELSFLAHVYQATWDPLDVEMSKLTCRGCGNYV